MGRSLSTHIALGACPLTALTVFHGFAALVDLGAFSVEAYYGTRPVLMKFAGIMSFLTLWGQLTQGLYFLFAFIVDLKVNRDLKDGWKWLHRSDSQSETFVDRNLSDMGRTLVSHRDRFFTLAFVVGNMVGSGYWLLLFPHKEVREDFLSDTRSIVTCLLQHGFTWIVINTETFSTNHKYGTWWVELIIVYVYGVGYLGWNLLVHAEVGAWVYPSIQAGHDLEVNLLMYGGLVILLGIYYCVGRFVSHYYWGYRERSQRAKRQSSDHGGNLLAGAARVEAPRWTSEGSLPMAASDDPFGGGAVAGAYEA